MISTSAWLACGPAIEIARSPDSRVSMKASVITVNATKRPRARRRAIRFSICNSPIAKHDEGVHAGGHTRRWPQGVIKLSHHASAAHARAAPLVRLGPRGQGVDSRL